METEKRWTESERRRERRERGGMERLERKLSIEKVRERQRKVGGGLTSGVNATAAAAAAATAAAASNH